MATQASNSSRPGGGGGGGGGVSSGRSTPNSYTSYTGASTSAAGGVQTGSSSLLNSPRSATPHDQHRSAPPNHQQQQQQSQSSSNHKEQQEGVDANAQTEYDPLNMSDSEILSRYGPVHEHPVYQSMFSSSNQDPDLPIANISRIMKRSLPENSKIAKDAKECIQACVSELISFVTSEAMEKCLVEKRKTINGDDLLYAFRVLGFDNYEEILKVYLSRYRIAQEINPTRNRKRVKNNNNAQTTGKTKSDAPDAADEDDLDEEDDDDEDVDEEQHQNQRQNKETSDHFTRPPTHVHRDAPHSTTTSTANTEGGGSGGAAAAPTGMQNLLQGQ